MVPDQRPRNRQQKIDVAHNKNVATNIAKAKTC